MDYGQLSLNLWNICKVIFYWDQTFSAEMILGDLVETQPSAVDLRLRQRQEIWGRTVPLHGTVRFLAFYEMKFGIFAYFSYDFGFPTVFFF